MLYVIFLAAIGLFGGFSQTGAQAKAFEDNYKNELAAIRYGLDAYDNIYSLLDEVEQQEVPRNGEVDLESSDGNIYGEIPDDHGRINELWEPDSRELDNSNTHSNPEVNSDAFNLMQVSTAETTKPTQAVPTMAIPTTSKDISSTLAPRTTQSKVLASIPVILPTLHPATPMPGGKKVLKFCEEGQKSTREKPCKKFRMNFHKQLKNNKQILKDIKRVRAKSKREVEKLEQLVSKTLRSLKNAKARSPKKLKNISSKLRKRNKMHHAKKFRKEWLHMMKSRKGQPKLQNILG